MTLTVRLSADLEQRLDRFCKARGVTKTHVVTELLTEHLAPRAAKGRSALDLAREFAIVGSFASAEGDLSENRKHYLKEKLRAKRAG